MFTDATARMKTQAVPRTDFLNERANTPLGEPASRLHYVQKRVLYR
ncbi:MAG TPA: hypothetical protein VFG28_15425 [Syntrophales bacterium]|nr:hypothetical protein [Syntrophales bacterium]